MSKLKYLIEYGLYLLAFLLPWQTRLIIRPGELGGGYSEYSTISLYGTDMLLFVLLVMFIFFKFFRPRRVRLGWKIFRQVLLSNFKITYYKLFTNYKLQIINYCIVGLLFISLISVFFSTDKFLALYRFGVLLMGVGLFLLIKYAAVDWLKLILAFLGGVFIQTGLGSWQFFTQSTFSNKWLGLAWHEAGALGASVIETVGKDGIGERWLRAYGGLDHPNVLGGLLVVGILLVVIILLESNKARSKKPARAGRLEARSRKTLFLTSYFLLFTSAAALFFTFSRSAWLGLAGGLGALLLAAVMWKDYPAQKKILEIILSGAILIFILTLFYGHLATTRLSSGTRLEIKSNIERIASFSEALGLIKERPLTGHGIGNYTIAAHRADNGKNPSWFYQPVHNSYLLAAAEIGIFGLLLLITLIAAVLKSGLAKIFTSTRNNKVYLVAGLIFALAVMPLFDHYWWSLHFGVLLFWFVLGIIARQEAGREARKEQFYLM